MYICVFCPYLIIRLFLDTEFYEQFIYFKYQHLVSLIIWKYLFTLSSFFFLLLIISLMSRSSNLIDSSVNFRVYFSLTDPKKMLLWLMPESVLPMFSSRNFLVSVLTFKYLICFKFICVYSMRKYSNIIVLHLVVQFSQHHLLKRMFIVCSYLLLCRLIEHRYVGLSLDTLFCSICLCVNAMLFSISVT